MTRRPKETVDVQIGSPSVMARVMDLNATNGFSFPVVVT